MLCACMDGPVTFPDTEVAQDAVGIDHRDLDVRLLLESGSVEPVNHLLNASFQGPAGPYFIKSGDVTLRGYSRYPGLDRSSFRSRPGHARLLPNPRITWLAAARMPPRMGSGIRINSCPPL